MSPSAVPTALNSSYRQIVKSQPVEGGLGFPYFILEGLVMLIISMPATTLVQWLDTLLKILYHNSLERSGNSMSNARINFPISKNSRGMYEKRLEHMILRDRV